MLNQDLQSTVFSPVKEFMCTKLHLVILHYIESNDVRAKKSYLAEDCTDDEQEA